MEFKSIIPTIVAVVVLALSTYFQPSYSYMINGNPYRQREILDENYILEWEYDPQRGNIVFNVTVKTEGFVGFGLTKNSNDGMKNADIFIAGVNSDGSTYSKDTHTRRGSGRVLLDDEQQDWVLLDASEGDGFTNLKFSRNINTCDDNDIEITKDRIVVIWAYGETDKIEYHYNNRGLMDAYLLDPNVTPQLEPDASGERGLVEDSNMIVYRLRKTYRLENRPTSYIVSIHKGLRFNQRHHVVGFKIYLGNEAAVRHIHHLVLYRCQAPEGVDPKSIFEPFLNYPGEEYYLNENRRIPSKFCEGNPYVVWGIGGKPFFLNEDIGMDIGVTPDEYFMMETHLDNNEMRSTTQLEVGIDVYITPRLRENTGQMLAIGFSIPGTLVVYPPATLSGNMIGQCDPACSGLMFPQEGVKASTILLHSHRSARKVTLRHFRNGKELPPVLSDDNYNPVYQQYRTLPEEVTFLPGDHLAFQCVLDNSQENGTTIGSFGTHQEMCLAFVIVNRVLSRNRCISEYPAYRMLSQLGVENITWDLVRQDKVVTSPQSLRGLTLSQVGDRYVRWTSQKRNELENDIMYAAHAMECQTWDIPSADEILRRAGVSSKSQGQRQQPSSFLSGLSFLGGIFSQSQSPGTNGDDLNTQVRRAIELQLQSGARSLLQRNDAGALIVREGTGAPDWEEKAPVMGVYNKGVPATAKFPVNAPKYNGNEDQGQSQCTIRTNRNENNFGKNQFPFFNFQNENVNELEFQQNAHQDQDRDQDQRQDDQELENYQKLPVLNFGY